MFVRIKKFYDRGFWTIEQVHFAVGANAITAEEYELITGKKYIA